MLHITAVHGAHEWYTQVECDTVFYRADDLDECHVYPNRNSVMEVPENQ